MIRNWAELQMIVNNFFLLFQGWVRFPFPQGHGERCRTQLQQQTVFRALADCLQRAHSGISCWFSVSLNFQAEAFSPKTDRQFWIKTNRTMHIILVTCLKPDQLLQSLGKYSNSRKKNSSLLDYLNYLNNSRRKPTIIVISVNQKKRV